MSTDEVRGTGTEISCSKKGISVVDLRGEDEREESAPSSGGQEGEEAGQW